MKELVVKILESALKKEKIKLEKDKILELIEIPREASLGDFAFPCFILASQLKSSPNQIAIKLRESIGKTPKEFEDIQSVGPYLNFFVDRKNLAIKTVQEVIKLKDKYGKGKTNKKNIMIEFPSPNTNKPLHLGHLRNMSIGESVSRIYEFRGYNVIRSNLNNDRGVHICKSMLAYQKWGEKKEPTKDVKGDHLVGDFYVLFAKKAKENTELEKEAQEMLQKWEKKDKPTLELWKKMNKWSLDGFKETYKKFGIKTDIEYFESQIYTKGKEIILDGLKKGIFKKNDEGAVVIDLSKENLGEKVLLRSDGTSIYITQDIYLAKLKFDEFKLDESIYVVANEQNYHFDVLFSILDKLKIADKNKLHHLAYGMVNLPEGRMKSREGTVVDADDLIDELQNLVKENLNERYKLTKQELEKRSLKIALSALKYFLLKVDIKKNMIFNPKESISFDGDTGPYLLYSYARAKSILRKVKVDKTDLFFEELEEKEIELVKRISEFPSIVEKSYEQKNPAIIANYSYQLAQTFNEFYHVCPVMDSDNEIFRLFLVEAFSITLKNSLALLGIETLEEM